MRNFLAQPAVTLLVCFILLVACGCKDRNSSSREKNATQVDESYTAALAIADMICQSWQQRDVERSRTLMSGPFLTSISDERLEDAIAGSDNPAHAAYELSKGRKISKGRYAFDVRLFYRYTGGHADKLEAPVETIEVVLQDSGLLRVDKFPLPPKIPTLEPSEMILEPRMD